MLENPKVFYTPDDKASVGAKQKRPPVRAAFSMLRIRKFYFTIIFLVVFWLPVNTV